MLRMMAPRCRACSLSETKLKIAGPLCPEGHSLVTCGLGSFCDATVLSTVTAASVYQALSRLCSQTPDPCHFLCR